MLAWFAAFKSDVTHFKCNMIFGSSGTLLLCTRVSCIILPPLGFLPLFLWTTTGGGALGSIMLTFSVEVTIFEIFNKSGLISFFLPLFFFSTTGGSAFSTITIEVVVTTLVSTLALVFVLLFSISSTEINVVFLQIGSVSEDVTALIIFFFIIFIFYNSL